VYFYDNADETGRVQCAATSNTHRITSTEAHVDHAPPNSFYPLVTHWMLAHWLRSTDVGIPPYFCKNLYQICNTNNYLSGCPGKINPYNYIEVLTIF
jgi:hypothetical protein